MKILRFNKNYFNCLVLREYDYKDKEILKVSEIKSEDLIIKVGRVGEKNITDIDYFYDGNSVGLETDSIIYWENIFNKDLNLKFEGKGIISIYTSPNKYISLEVSSGVKLKLMHSFNGIKLKIKELGFVEPMFGDMFNYKLNEIEKEKWYWVHENKIYNEEEWLIKGIIE